MESNSVKHFGNAGVNNANRFKSKNPLVWLAHQQYIYYLRKLLTPLDIKSAIDVTCGECYVTDEIAKILSDITIVALDGDRRVLEVKPKSSNVRICGVITLDNDVPSLTNCYDLVICTESLEHMKDYRKALEEIKRITRRYVLFSVPQEPLATVLNLLQFRYVNSWGMGLGHVNFWSVGGFKKLISEYFNVLEVRTTIPSTIILAEKRYND